jgi:epoxide hydrolase 4
LSDVAAAINADDPLPHTAQATSTPSLVLPLRLDHLVGDVVDMLAAIDGPVVLVGHDWGGGVAWAVASRHPDLIEGLVIVNGPHLNVFADELANNPDQTQAFSYVDSFVQPGFEDTLAANDFFLLSFGFTDLFTDEEMAAYKVAWGQERALEGGLNWYRANFEDSLPIITEELNVSVPTLVVWGMKDEALLPGNLDGLDAYVSDLTIQEVPEGTHWVAHEQPIVVADAIRTFSDARTSR